MSTLSDSLIPENIKNDAGLPLAVVSIANMPMYLEYISSRISAKSDYIETALANSAGPYNWPFSDATLQLIYTNQSEEERELTYYKQFGLAQEATRYYVLGDLYHKASERNPSYFEKAKTYWSMGHEILEGLTASIKIAVSGGNSNDKALGGSLGLISIRLPNKYDTPEGDIC